MGWERHGVTVQGGLVSLGGLLLPSLPLTVMGSELESDARSLGLGARTAVPTLSREAGAASAGDPAGWRIAARVGDAPSVLQNRQGVTESLLEV